MFFLAGIMSKAFPSAQADKTTQRNDGWRQDSDIC